MHRLARMRLRRIPPYVPGRSIEDVAREIGIPEEKLIKLNGNENPFGPPPRAIERIKEILESRDLAISRYPDPLSRELREKLSDYCGVDQENIIVCNGSDEAIDLITKSFLGEGDFSAVCIPTFPYYEISALSQGAEVIYVPRREDGVDVDALLEDARNCKLIFLCSPNNPTGDVISRRDLTRILEEFEGIVVVDEAYYEFHGESFVDLVESNDLIVLRTFSKAFGLAGLRIGYMVASEEIIETIMRVKPPFNVSVVAQVAALGALEDLEHLRKTIINNARERSRLTKKLGDLGLRVRKSRANFILVETEPLGLRAPEFVEELERRGILVRDVSRLRGASDYMVRISIGTPDQNDKLISVLEDLARISPS